MLIPDAHAGHITFEQYEKHQATLAANAAFRGQERRAGPPREGPAALRGLAICGTCGKRMAATYHARCNGELLPDYVYRREGIATGTPPCQTICGHGVDEAVADLVLEQLTPLAIETALQVSAELAKRKTPICVIDSDANHPAIEQRSPGQSPETPFTHRTIRP